MEKVQPKTSNDNGNISTRLKVYARLVTRLMVAGCSTTLLFSPLLLNLFLFGLIFVFKKALRGLVALFSMSACLFDCLSEFCASILGDENVVSSSGLRRRRKTVEPEQTGNDEDEAKTKSDINEASTRTASAREVPDCVRQRDTEMRQNRSRDVDHTSTASLSSPTRRMQPPAPVSRATVTPTQRRVSEGEERHNEQLDIPQFSLPIRIPVPKENEQSADPADDLGQNLDGLPPGWSFTLAASGLLYIINTDRRRSIWLLPPAPTPAPNSPTAAAAESRHTGPLPAGWEGRVTDDGRKFFVNHGMNDVQEEDPRASIREPAPRNDDENANVRGEGTNSSSASTTASSSASSSARAGQNALQQETVAELHKLKAELASQKALAQDRQIKLRETTKRLQRLEREKAARLARPLNAATANDGKPWKPLEEKLILLTLIYFGWEGRSAGGCAAGWMANNEAMNLGRTQDSIKTRIRDILLDRSKLVAYLGSEQAVDDFLKRKDKSDTTNFNTDTLPQHREVKPILDQLRIPYNACYCRVCQVRYHV